MAGGLLLLVVGVKFYHKLHKFLARAIMMKSIKSSVAENFQKKPWQKPSPFPAWTKL
jgi:hypothetical protein